MAVGVSYTHSCGKDRIKEYHSTHWMPPVGHGVSATTVKQWTKKHAQDLITNMGNGFGALFYFIFQFERESFDLSICVVNHESKIAYNSHLDELSCEYAAQPNTCARTACECDLQLAQSLYEYSYDFNQDYMASKGFDPAQECKASREGGQQTALVDSCCGNSPNRNIDKISFIDIAVII